MTEATAKMIETREAEIECAKILAQAYVLAMAALQAAGHEDPHGYLSEVIEAQQTE